MCMTEPKDKAEISNQFNLFFTNISPELANKIKNKIIDHLENKNRFGMYGISNSLKKSVKKVLVKHITILIIWMLTTGVFTDQLKVVKIVPSYEKGDNTPLFTDLYLFYHHYLRYL